MQETWVQSLGWENPLEKEMATHSSILAWRIPWTEEPGGLHTVHGVAESDVTEYQQNSGRPGECTQNILKVQQGASDQCGGGQGQREAELRLSQTWHPQAAYALSTCLDHVVSKDPRPGSQCPSLWSHRPERLRTNPNSVSFKCRLRLPCPQPRITSSVH